MAAANRNQYTEQQLINTIKTYLPDNPVTMNDLKNPNHAFICNCYTAFLTELGVNTTNLVQIQMNQMTLISHVDMYNQTVPLINLYISVNYFLSHIGISDFSLSDLLNPSPKRTVLHLNALMNFLIYCDETIGGLHGDLERISNLREKRNELCSKIEMLRNDINKKATERVKRKEKIKELEKIVLKDKNKLDELFVEKETQKKAVEIVKKTMVQDDEKEAQLVRVIKNLEEDIDRFNSMIVTSPEKLKEDLQQLIVKKEECIESVKCLKIQIEEKKKLTKTFSHEIDEQKNRSEKLKELLEIEKIICDMDYKYDILQQQHNKYVEDVEEINQNIVNQQQKFETLQAAVNELRIRKSKQNTEKKDELQMGENEHKMLVMTREEKQQFSNQIQMKIDMVYTKIEALNHEIKENYDKFVKDNENINKKEEEFQQFYENILRRLKEMNKNMEIPY